MKRRGNREGKKSSTTISDCLTIQLLSCESMGDIFDETKPRTGIISSLDDRRVKDIGLLARRDGRSSPRRHRRHALPHCRVVCDVDFATHYNTLILTSFALGGATSTSSTLKGFPASHAIAARQVIGLPAVDILLSLLAVCLVVLDC